MLKLIFWILLFLFIYPLFIYPIIITFISLFKVKKSYIENKSRNPLVTIIISAYNEEKVIKRKIENCMGLNYNQIQILIGSDGSTDKTHKIINSIIAKNKNVKKKIDFYIFKRIGKNDVINKLWKYVKGEFVVFSDANSMYDKEALKKLVNSFNSDEIGLVCGKLTYKNDSSKSESLYWRYENYLKVIESRLNNLLVANGSIFAMRKKLFKKLNSYIANDFQIPNYVNNQGYYVIYEPNAIAYENTANSFKKEFIRKIRIINRGLTGFFNINKNYFSLRFFELFSHKFLRWLSGLFLLFIFLTNILLINENLYLYLFSIQILFYFLSFVGFILKKNNIPIINQIFYFSMIQVSTLVGLFRFIFYKRQKIWEIQR
jgi:cellulose synthase/poly-beta-1,6-N-acetylglucosamine synthase-like glycosyltransferase